MSKRNICFKILMSILLIACCSFAALSNSKNDPNKPDTNTRMTPEQIARFEREITNTATQSFISSLEMKENVEFLLTPALLMQENMSPETIITYPSE